ncbi:MAG: efflux RND transporter periplasmic adaptor subunit, partial [Candidatus Acidiferrales bacterium]
LNAYVDTNGRVEPIGGQILRAQFETTVESILVKEGQAIRRGEPILTLDVGSIRADLAQAQVDLLAAQDDLRNARAGGPPDEAAQLTGDIRRAQVDVDHLQARQTTLEKLLEAHASTRDEVEQNAASLARARALLDSLEKKQSEFTRRANETEESASLRVHQAEEQIRFLDSKKRAATATSASDGTIYSLAVHAGDYVQPGEILAEIADLHKVRVRVFVDETDLGSLNLNQAVKISWDAMPGRTWTGRIEQTPKQVVARGARSVGEVLCSVENHGLELLPNVNVDVEILVRESHNALAVPRGTVHTDQKGHFVFVLDGDRLTRRAVSLGVASSTHYEILSGLGEGDRIALSSDLDLHDGMVVRTVEQN